MNFQIIIQPPDTESNWTAFNRECEDLNSDFLMQPINEADYDSETQACVDMRSENGPRSFYHHYVTKRRKKKGIKGLGVEHPARYGKAEEDAAAKGRVMRVTPTDSVGFGGPSRGEAVGKGSHEQREREHSGDSCDNEGTVALSSSTPSKLSMSARRNARRKAKRAAAAAAAAAIGGSEKGKASDGSNANGSCLRKETGNAYSDLLSSAHDDASASESHSENDEDIQISISVLNRHVHVYTDAYSGVSSETLSKKGSNTSKLKAQTSNFLSLPPTTLKAAGTPSAAGGCGKKNLLSAHTAMPPRPAGESCTSGKGAVKKASSQHQQHQQKSPQPHHPADFLDVPNKITAQKGALSNAAIRRIACGRNPTPVWNAPTGFRYDGVHAHDSGIKKDGENAEEKVEEKGLYSDMKLSEIRLEGGKGIEESTSAADTRGDKEEEEPVITCTITVVGGGVPSFACGADIDAETKDHGH